MLLAGAGYLNDQCVMKPTNNSPPTVTFALLTYNQRDYVIEAIKGAIAQDYSNLEIIVSDDCSTDGTFALIKSFAKSYKGPHTLRINQTSENKCILGHFFDVVDLANGRLLILAAGDDISYPNRVRETVSAWANEAAVGLFSNYDLMDQGGSILEKNFSPNAKSKAIDRIFGNPLNYGMHGASSAYDLDFVKSLPRPAGRLYFEDTFMTFMIILHGKTISKINKPLVGYRSHSASLSNSHFSRSSFSEIYDGELRAAHYSANKHDLYLFLFEYASRFLQSRNRSDVNLSSLNDYISRISVKGRWIKTSFDERARNLVKHRQDRDFVRWMAPRLFGLHIFSTLRYLKNIFSTGQ